MKKLITLIAVLGFGISAASAASLEDLQVKELNKKANAKITGYNDGVAMKVTYVGTSTQCVVNVTTGDFKSYVPGPDATADLAFSLSATAYDTMGELCDAIDDDDDYTCELVDVKRDDASIKTQSVTKTTSQNAKAVGGYDVKIDSGGAGSGTWVDGTQFLLRLGITPQSGKRVVLKYCKALGTGADTLKVYGKLAKYANATDGVTRNDTTQVFKFDLPTITTTTIGNQYDGNWLEFATDEHVVVGSLDNDTAQDASNYVECIWDEK